MARELCKKTHKKVFRDVAPEGFGEVFKKVFWKEKSKLSHPVFILSYYQKNDYWPELVMNHLFNGDLAKADDYYMRADEHGLNAEMFQAGAMKGLIYKLTAKN